jgi:hypothetical protein
VPKFLTAGKSIAQDIELVLARFDLRTYPETGVFSKRYMTTGYGFAQNASSYLGEHGQLDERIALRDLSSPNFVTPLRRLRCKPLRGKGL